MQRYTACVVGAGKGGRLSLRALSKSDRFSLLAVADVRPDACEKARADFPGIKTFASHDEMFAACPADVVCVSTWPPSHREIALAALRLPLKGILVEKPLADRAAPGREILEAVKRKGIPMAVPHGQQTDNHVREILARVRRGELGSLRVVEIQKNGWDILNAGIHLLDFAVTLVNEPMKSVLALCDRTSRTFRDGMQVETEAVTYAISASGVRIAMHTGDEIPIEGWEKAGTLIRILGDRGSIVFPGREESAYILQTREFPEPRRIEVSKDPRTHHRIHLDNLAGMIDRGEKDYALPESSLAALELCEAAYLSSRHGCRVDLPLAKFVPPTPNDWRPGEPYSGTGGGRDGQAATLAAQKQKK